MKLINVIAILFVSVVPSWAFTYFQQEVDYKMDIKFYPEDNTYTGEAVISYTNNSPSTLNNIFFHLWTNSYSTHQSALNQQLVRTGNVDMHFANEENLGGYQSVTFTQNGLELKYENYKDQIDIIQLQLHQPVASSETIEIKVSFEVKVPIFFSRMGRTEGFYQMTQWYPKPAVLDQDGWHPMPYLDMGEFYSEFGDYEVTISIPSDYQVAATGMLTKTEESEDQYSSYQFVAERVHDFAWVASDHFQIQKENVKLSSGEDILLQVFRINESEAWDESMEFLKEAVLFYSEEVGSYPYPQATVVQSPGGTGGGMEYPMLTTIDTENNAKDVDRIIAHEVGHNWFYGILATNERTQAWMDEGINSFYDHLYIKEKYNSKTDISVPKFINSGSDQSLVHTAVVWQCKRGRNQACNVHSNELNLLNYGISAYEYPAQSLQYLERYLGKDKFSKCIKNYYENWKFRHPGVDDLVEVFESTAGEDLDWFFDGLLFQDGYIDYKISNIKQVDNGYKVSLKNNGNVNIPIRLDAKTGEEWIAHTWVPVFKKDTTIFFETSDSDHLQINGQYRFLDVNPENNGMPTQGFNKKSLPAFKLLPRIDNPEINEVFVMPFMGWNYHDRFYLGLGILNSTFPQKWFRWNVNAAYAFGTKDLVGTFKAEKDFMLDSEWARKITVHADGRRFHYDQLVIDNEIIQDYYKIKPGITLHLAPDLAERKESRVSYFFHYLNTEEANVSSEGNIDIVRNGQVFHELSYNHENKGKLHPYSIKFEALQHNYTVRQIDEDNSFLRMSGSLSGTLRYNAKAKLHYRVSAAYFPVNSARHKNSFNNDLAKGSINLAFGDAADVTFDHLYTGRNSNDHWTEKQIYTRSGGFKVPLIYNAGNLGKSNHAAFAINLKTDIPIPLFRVIPLRPYVDIGYYASPEAEESFDWNLIYDFGLALEVFDGILGIYFPIVQSNDIDRHYKDLGGYGRRISFQIDFHKLRPWDFIDRFDM